MIKPKLHVDLQWLNRISYSLERFRKIKTDVFNCRCNVCGDSKTHKRKTRLYFYVKKSQLNVMCQNCGYSHSFYTYMKDHFTSLFDDYKRETLFDVFTDKKVTTEIRNTSSTKNVNDHIDLSLDELKSHMYRVSELPLKHPAVMMLKSRKFSKSQIDRLYYVDDFQYIASIVNKEAAKNLPKYEPRIIIPFVSELGNVEMIQGRSLKDVKNKYISIKRHDDIDKVYGKYEVDPTETVYCTEGPFDSLFVDNCLASCDANLTRIDADVYIWDNQPRNLDVIKYMQSAIDRGLSVVIWPTSPDQKQDINDLIKLGISQEMLMDVIKQCTFKGMTAKLMFSKWKRI